MNFMEMHMPRLASIHGQDIWYRIPRRPSGISGPQASASREGWSLHEGPSCTTQYAQQQQQRLGCRPCLPQRQAKPALR